MFSAVALIELYKQPYRLGKNQVPVEIWGYAPWRQVPNRTTNPQLILARLWGETKGEGIVISRKTYSGTKLIPELYTVLATASVAEILDKVCQTPELTVLTKSDNNFMSEPNMNRCEWDYNTRKRVNAFRWHRQAEGYTAMADEWLPRNPRMEIRWRVMAITSQTRADILLENSRPSTPLTPQDIKSLIYQVLARELTQGKRKNSISVRPKAALVS